MTVFWFLSPLLSVSLPWEGVFCGNLQRLRRRPNNDFLLQGFDGLVPTDLFELLVLVDPFDLFELLEKVDAIELRDRDGSLDRRR